MPVELAPNVGLDIGTSFIIAARGLASDKSQISYTEFRDAFFRIQPTSPISARMIEKGLSSKKFFRDTDDAFIVVGQDAIEKAVERHQSVRRPLYKGILSPKETDARRILKFILQDILGQPRVPGEKLVYSVPAPPVDYDEDEFDVGYHEDAAKNDLADLGYDPRPINEAEAICYSELESNDYTGLGISCGAGMQNFCLMSSGEAVLKWSTTKAGDYIDRMAAKSCGEEESVVQVEKENGAFEVGVENKENRILSAVAAYYSRVIEYTTRWAEIKLSTAKTLPRFAGPIPVIVSGGTSRAKGFVAAFERSLRNKRLPLQISEVRAAGDPLRAVARGALIASSL